ncbi:hypothetical protein D1007_31212 [Hordeum vulgare]|nr:hypothetical protein D1007_31212 [Hordeum vulgare]
MVVAGGWPPTKCQQPTRSGGTCGHNSNPAQQPTKLYLDAQLQYDTADHASSLSRRRGHRRPRRKVDEGRRAITTGRRHALVNMRERRKMMTGKVKSSHRCRLHANSDWSGGRRQHPPYSGRRRTCWRLGEAWERRPVEVEDRAAFG